MTQETALAQPQAAPLAPQQPKKQSMLERFGEAYGIEPLKFFNAVKVASGCGQLDDAYFMVLLAQAEKYQLDPLSSPPQLQIFNPGNGHQVYARLDAYKAFLIRAEKDGTIEEREYEEGWYPDARQPPATDKTKQVLRRGGKVTLKLKGWPKPRTKIVWWDEWNKPSNPNWKDRGSHMLEGRAWKEACRDYLGYHIQDMDDAAITGDQMRQVTDAEVRDATPIRPSIPIAGLQRPALPPPAAEPFTIDVPKSEPVEAAQGKPTEGGPVTAVSQPPSDAATTASSVGETPASPAPSPDFDEAESRRLDAEEAERQKNGELFS